MSEIKWIPVVIRQCNEDEREMYGCDTIIDNEVPEDEEFVLITTKRKYVTAGHYVADWNAFEYYDWDEVLAWAKFPEPYKG